uniref:Truncated envelope glycoprotein n=1 Tax=Human immunodeficiency virus type 1 TaxID=11676 RepID=A0A0H3YD10_HV1|nr:truncated envelope glycoprotein [Human immunodeficiency virus 1]
MKVRGMLKNCQQW